MTRTGMVQGCESAARCCTFHAQRAVRRVKAKMRSACVSVSAVLHSSATPSLSLSQRPLSLSLSWLASSRFSSSIRPPSRLDGDGQHRIRGLVFLSHIIIVSTLIALSVSLASPTFVFCSASHVYHCIFPPTCPTDDRSFILGLISV